MHFLIQKKIDRLQKEDEFMAKHPVLKTLIQILASIIVLIAFAVLAVDGYVKFSVSNRIITQKEAANLKKVDCILVLGAGVNRSGNPTPMLKDRLLTSIELYQKSVSDKLLMSGDHGRKSYDEVNTMKKFAIDRSIPSSSVFMDHAGFSTYESLYRAKEIFKAKKLVIVTQEYHLYRALYIAQKLGIEAYGVSANKQRYAGQGYRNIREIFARNKDFITAIIQPKPTYLGETIPVSGNGDLTND